jgi:hypothetical protein
MKKRNKHEPGVFFTDPSDNKVTEGTKNTVETFVEGVHDKVDTRNLSEDYQRFINLKYQEDKNKAI